MADLGRAASRSDRIVDSVGGLLRVGTIAVVALVVAGTVLVIASGRRPLADHGPGFDVARMVADILALRPEGFLWLGILLTVVLPGGRVALATLGFARDRDRRGTAIGLAILAILGLSILLAVAAVGA